MPKSRDLVQQIYVQARGVVSAYERCVERRSGGARLAENWLVEQRLKPPKNSSLLTVTLCNRDKIKTVKNPLI
jgi:hypothetical protein